MTAGRENRVFIGIYGGCNVGKSTLLNFITDSSAVIVSAQSGTTTDPIQKGYEIVGFAPAMFIDTAGFDDNSTLGELRVQKSLQTIKQIDLAILVYREWRATEQELVDRFEAAHVPYMLINNIFAGDHSSEHNADIAVDLTYAVDSDRNSILDAIKSAIPQRVQDDCSMFGSSISANDTILLVCPIDGEAPTGRLILPQVQALREILDRRAIAVVLQPSQLKQYFENSPLPRLVVADSQVLKEVEDATPDGVEVTSFSILLAASKGDYDLYLSGLQRIDSLQSGDRILIVENCAHQVNCDDIGRVKIPRWLAEYAGAKLNFTTISGLDPLPDDIADYALMVQCGGCMSTRRQLLNRIHQASSADVAVTNYGMLIRKIRR